MDMSEQYDLRELERRLSRSLHTTAPQPAADFADRVLRRTAVARQRRGPLGLAFAPALAAASVLVLAVVVGLGIGSLLVRGPSPGDPVSSSLPSPTPSPSATAPAPTASPPAAAFPGGDASCENESIGFVATYPADWWANELVDSGDPALTPIEACLYFAEEPVQLVQNAGLSPAIAIIAALEEVPAGNPEQPIEVVSSREVEVDGLPATAEEIEWTADTGFQRAGDRSYGYRIRLSDGRVLLFATGSQPPSDQYEARKDVLDRMMEVLDITGEP
jgi:hypothetical protein